MVLPLLHVALSDLGLYAATFAAGVLAGSVLVPRWVGLRRGARTGSR